MGELGTRLREAREELGLTLDDAEDRTRIRRAFLEAIEDERFFDLPGDVYARGFIRNYASLLGLDAEELLQAYRTAAHISTKSIPQVLDEPLVRRSRSSVNWTIGLVVLAVAVVGAGLWYLYSYYYAESSDWAKRRASASRDATASASAPTLVATATLPRLAQATATLSEGRVATPTTRAPVTTQSTPTALVPTATLRPTDTPLPTATSTASATPTRAGNIRVEARLLAKTYVEIRVDGELIFVDILEAGQHQTWTANEALALRIGNAGGIRLIVNGVDVGIMGEPQQVIDVAYTLDNLPQG